ncbi:unnamed protein product [Colias eurytheme]|nr:unnamed protein product [Colias eurytheme]
MSSQGKRLYCQVYGCLNETISNPELTFFKIPTEKERCSQWLRLIDRNDLIGKIKDHYRVCEVHFSKEVIKMNTQRKLLAKGAVPSLFLPVRTRDNQIQTDLPISRLTICQIENIDIPANPSSDTEPTDNPRKRKLRTILSNASKRMKIQETEESSTESHEQMFEKLCDCFLTKDLAEVVKDQIKLTSNNRGNMYTLEYKMFCLNLYSVNPQAYRLLQDIVYLPSPSTLNKLYIPITTQINDELFAALKVKLTNMSDREKNCSIVVDAMTLKANLFYDLKNDKIIGFHEVDGVQSPSPAKHALVILVRGISINWHQPIGFALLSECKSDHAVSIWIDKLILKLFEIGLKVRTFISDLGSDLLNAAKQRGISVAKTYFSIENHKIYYIVDVPYLIKLVRNDMLNYNIQFSDSRIAKFEHIVKFYELDHVKTFKQAYKLTNSHINPTTLERMKVRYATQLLSRTVACGISTYIDFNVLDESAKDTVEFIQKMNDLFDALNSSTFRDHYPYKNAYSGEDCQRNFFIEMLTLIKSIKLIHPIKKNDVTKTVKFIQGFQITIQSILDLFDDLKQEGHKFLLTRRLNRDIFDNFFGKIRSKNGNATKPTARKFISAYRKIYFTNIAKLPKEGNCSEDLSEFLFHLKDLPNNDTNSTVENNFRDITRSQYTQMEIPEKNAFHYVCGALFKKCVDRHGSCELLKSYMNENWRNLSAETRDDITSPSFVVPPDNFVRNIERMETIFSEVFKRQHITANIGMSIYNSLLDSVDFASPCPCFPKTFLYKLYTRMRIYFTLLENNKAFRTGRNRRKYFSVTKL